VEKSSTIFVRFCRRAVHLEGDIIPLGGTLICDLAVFVEVCEACEA
jgi:hypothetical protein